MKLSLKARSLKRYKEIARLLLKYGRSDIVQQFGLDEAMEKELAHSGAGPAPEELAKDLEEMGPTFVKFGQLLSSRPDLLPAPYLEALRRLQDKVAPFPFAEVERLVQQELGVRISKAFSYFEETPIAAASLGQVHRAALRDGRPVAVKVQRPDVRKLIADDIEVLEEIAGFLDEHSERARRYQFVKIFDEFKTTLLRELDYQREADHMVTFSQNLEEFPLIVIPLPIEDYTTRSILTMDFVRGRKITKISPLARLEMDGAVLSEELFRAYLKQVLVDGVFHADPHPGNVFLTDDGRVALIDLGMVGRVAPAIQEKLVKVLIAVSEGNGDEASELVIQMSETMPDFDEVEFRRKAGQLVAEHQDRSLRQMQIGKALLDVARTAGEAGLYVPTDLTLLGKTLLQLDEIGRALDPNFNPNASVRRNVTEIMNQRVRKHLTPGKLFSSLLDMKEFVATLPLRVNKILDAVANSEVEVRVKVNDVREILDSLHKVANRLTAGIILAALIVGASLMMQVDTDFRLFGFPGLGILFFLLAAGGALWLVFNILVRDRRKKRRLE